MISTAALALAPFGGVGRDPGTVVEGVGRDPGAVIVVGATAAASATLVAEGTRPAWWGAGNEWLMAVAARPPVPVAAPWCKCNSWLTAGGATPA